MTIFSVPKIVHGNSLRMNFNSEVTENLFEGDIILDEASELAKNGFTGSYRRWPKYLKNPVMIPYVISKTDFCKYIKKTF